MADTVRYRKPNMANLPADIGVPILKQILSTPAPDRTAMRIESAKLLKKMAKERALEDAIHQRLKPNYDKDCIFMYQVL